jgi:hypothetical protein
MNNVYNLTSKEHWAHYSMTWYSTPHSNVSARALHVTHVDCELTKYYCFDCSCNHYGETTLRQWRKPDLALQFHGCQQITETIYSTLCICLYPGLSVPEHSGNNMHEGVTTSSSLSEHFRMKSLLALIVSSGFLKGSAASFPPHQHGRSPRSLPVCNWSTFLKTVD